jgi:hypothetical protein
MSAADLVARLAQQGIDAALLADVAQELFTAEIERKTLADRRQNERDRKARSRDRTGHNGTARERRGPPKEEINTPHSVPDGTGGEPPNPVKDLFDLGVSLLTAQGQNEKQARSLIGKWRQGRNDGDVAAALLEARTRSISNLVEWMPKRLSATGPPKFFKTLGEQSLAGASR